MTKRRKLVVFQGHYNGHFDESLVALTDAGQVEADLLGLRAQAFADTIILPFNDINALEVCLSKRDVALVLTEPVMTNCTLVKPDPGYLSDIETLTRKYETVLCYDEAHTFQFAYGGLVRDWKLKSDFVVLGKGLGTGISFALYGMNEAVADFFTKHSDIDIGPKGIATGGTTYATNVAIAAAKAALFEILTPDAYARIDRLGKRMADGLQSSMNTLGLPWLAPHIGPRAVYCLNPTPARSGLEAWKSMDTEIIDTRRIYLANRGIWDSIASSGPQASLVHTEQDIDNYVKHASDFLSVMVGRSY